MEVGAIIACAAVSAALWGRELPTELLRPDLAPEQMVQLLSALHACCAVLAVRRESADFAQMAAVGLLGRRLSWVAIVLAVTMLTALAAGAAMPTEVAGQFVRNVVAYVGVGLLLSSLSLALALAAPWIWFAMSVTVGQTSDRGAAVADWWAYPLHDAGFHPMAAVVLMVAGASAWLVRR